MSIQDELIVVDNDLDHLDNTTYKIASFDLDHTLIKPKGKTIFPKNKDDWVLLPNVKEVLNQYVDNNYKIVIFSNQGSKKTTAQDLIDKCNNISTELEIPIVYYLSIGKVFRKPNTQMYEYMIETKYKNKLNKQDIFYCGDALGRENDFSDSDLKFALNLEMNIFTPEQIFQTNLINKYLPLIDNTCLAQNIKFKPFEYFNNVHRSFSQACGSKIHLQPSDVSHVNESKLVQFESPTTREVVILVGPPASGKSTLAINYFPNYKYINQDTLLTKSNCIKQFKVAFEKSNSNIIIDNTNKDIKNRNIWIDLIKKSNLNIKMQSLSERSADVIKIICIFIDIPKHVVMHLNKYRSLTSNKNVPDIAIHSYYKNIEIPTLDEGFDNIIVINKIELNPLIDHSDLIFKYLI
jgi:bifunctional polynucleotide phosphatase/kinase